MGFLVRAPNRYSALGAKPLVGGLRLEDHQVAVALMENVGRLPSMVPISALHLVLGPSAALSLPVGGSELCGQLATGKLCRTDSKNC